MKARWKHIFFIHSVDKNFSLESYLAMPLCSAYQAVIFSSHISAVIWYCIKTWNTQKCQNGNLAWMFCNHDKINSFKVSPANVLFLVKAHPEPESQVCESLDHSPHTVFGMEAEKSIQNQYFDHNKSRSKLNYYRQGAFNLIRKEKYEIETILTFAWTAYDAKRTEASGEQKISSSSICFFTYTSMNVHSE